MTTLIKSYPYTHFFLGKIDAADVVAARAADPGAATEAGGTVTIGTKTVMCQDFAYAMTSFTPAEGASAVDVTSLVSEVGQSGEGRPSWEAACVMRAYVSDPEVATDSVKIVRDHSGYYVLYAEHLDLGKLAAVVLFDAMSEPFTESGELTVTYTLKNSGQKIPKWIA